MSLENIILNDTFRTKQVSLSSLTDSLKGSQKPFNIHEKEALTFDIDDVQVLKTISNGTITFGDYDSERDIDPTSAVNNRWSRYGYLGDRCNIGAVPLDIFPKMTKSLLINDTTRTNICYFYKLLTNEQQEQIKSTGVGVCSFEIAILPYSIVRRPASYGNPASVDKEFFKTRFRDQQNFVSFGAFDPSNPTLQFRFSIIFSSKFIPETDSWEVYAFQNLTEPDEDGVLIPNWDGFSLRSFKCDYGPNLDGQIVAELFMLQGNKWISIRDNIQPYNVATYPNAPEFGSYSTTKFASLAIKNFNFKAFVRDEYNFVLNGKFYETFSDLLDYCHDFYSYKVNGTGTIDVNWFFNNKQNSISLNETNSTVNFNKNWFSTDNLNTLKFFEKKYKNIKILADRGSITSFLNPNKKIYNINLSDLENLVDLDLSNNLLKSLDISHNLLLKNINVSGNKDLETLILPKGNAFQLSSLNVTNTKIKRLELVNPKATLVEVNLIINKLDSLENLTLQGIKITDPETFVNIEFPNLKEVNISESNILTNKNNLELFLDNLPDRNGKEPGVVYLYGKKYTSGGIQGSAKDIAQTLNNLKNKNWLFYL